MKTLIVYSHPEPRSLNSALRDVAVHELEAQGHEVQVSDLYAMQWQSEISRTDFPLLDDRTRLHISNASKEGFNANALTNDVQTEQEKLLWADTLILQFPLWWFTMPAILKGWVDRVYSCGFAHGIGDHSDKRWGNRYGEGRFEGKRAMLIVTAGGWEEHYSQRGINGPINDLLFPINHGILFCPGYTVLPSFVAYNTDRLDEAGFSTLETRLRERMQTIETISPIPYRRQNFGDYHIPTMQLRPDLDSPDAVAFLSIKNRPTNNSRHISR